MLEKSIYEQLNEIDDTCCLEDWKKDDEVLEENTTLNDAARGKSPLDQAEDYVLNNSEIEALKGKSIKEIMQDLQALKSRKLREFHLETPSNREKLRGLGFDV